MTLSLQYLASSSLEICLCCCEHTKQCIDGTRSSNLNGKICRFVHSSNCSNQERYSSTNTSPVLLNGTPIEIVIEMRVLGVIVDNKLSWPPHVESVMSKVCRKIDILQRNKHQLTHFARRLVYMTIIQQDLEYATVTTVPFMSASLMGCLCSVWRRAVRCIAGADWQVDVHVATPLGSPHCSCHPTMYSKIGPSDPLQETNFYRTFTPN